jgi:Tol biopolymer transport system component
MLASAPSRLSLLTAAAAAAALALPGAAGAARYATALVSVPGTLGSQSAVSGDGRQIAYVGTVAGSAHPQIVVRDRLTGATRVASRAPGHDGALADGPANRPSISRDGRYVAFGSTANNLSPDDDDSVANVYRRDLSTGTTTLVSVAPNGTPGNNDSGAPDISPDGRYVAFESEATSLYGLALTGIVNVFLRDLGQNELKWVNQPAVQGGATYGAYNPSVSEGGARVVFDTQHQLILGDDSNGVRDVYMRSMSSASLTIVSRDSSGGGGLKGNASSHSGVISADGSTVAFTSNATNLSTIDDPNVADVFVRDLAAGQTELVSRTGGLVRVGGNGISRAPAISADGRKVAYSTVATNLHYQDSNGVEDVLVLDRDEGSPRLASRAAGSGGVPNESDALEPALSGDGRWVAFSSRSTNLVAGAGGALSSVFARGLADGSPWEPQAPPEGPDPGGGGGGGGGDVPPGGGSGGGGGTGDTPRGGGDTPGAGRPADPALTATPKAKRIAANAPVVLSYVVGERVRLRAVLSRALPGVRFRGRCVARTPKRSKGRSCTRLKQAGARTLKAVAKGGELRLAPPRAGWPAGSYRLVVTATDTAGATTTRTLRLTVVAVRGGRR